MNSEIEKVIKRYFFKTSTGWHQYFKEDNAERWTKFIKELEKIE